MGESKNKAEDLSPEGEPTDGRQAFGESNGVAIFLPAADPPEAEASITAWF